MGIGPRAAPGRGVVSSRRARERHMVGYLLTAADFIDNGACQWRKRVQAIRNSSILEALYQLRAAASEDSCTPADAIRLKMPRDHHLL